MYEKYSLIMEPILVTLQKLIENTILKKPESTHEKWFIFTYGEGKIILQIFFLFLFLVIKNCFDSLKNLSNIYNSESKWLPFKEV